MQTVTVVGVAVLRMHRDGRRRLLAARRTAPPQLAGRWELPGGKRHEGEPIDAAAVREVREELGWTVRVTGHLDGAVPIRPGLELRVVTAEPVEGEPRASEHDLLRWLTAEELGDIDWLAPDLPFLEQLAHRLEETTVDRSAGPLQ